MTAQTIDHAAEAARLVEVANEKGDIREAEVAVAAAQVHATLALAAAQQPAPVDHAAADALRTVVAAWSVEGRDPVTHHRAQGQLRLEWPVLARALDHVARFTAGQDYGQRSG
ncbi:hypothetical protein QWJ90_01390 [Microbacterium oryzae]|uniref:hypothetical protein n=1 Tax=Microbacterium oryzae TaxID=743009 RepID=UPI0025B0F9AE|nr:hypothetical protein [Microbacterium oryzae]MDN3309576.1 hypothetical protein [Microbacterium oryzae]